MFTKKHVHYLLTFRDLETYREITIREQLQRASQWPGEGYGAVRD